MAKIKKNKENWLKKSIRVVGMNPSSFEEFWKFRINNIQIISIILLFIVTLFIFNYLIFAYTPLGHLLPENIKNRNRQVIKEAVLRIADLEEKIDYQDRYINNLQKVILGETSIDSVYYIDDSYLSTSTTDFDIDTTISEEEIELDKSLRITEEKYRQTQKQNLNHLLLFDPIEGEISQKFKIPSHPGVDIVTQKDTQIKACLDGIVIYSAYTNKDGHIIIISHKNQLISTYKHAKSVNVQMGSRVKTGEVIGVVGNTGESSTSSHLHFELWNENGPLNPLDYFSFGK